MLDPTFLVLNMISIKSLLVKKSENNMQASSLSTVFLDKKLNILVRTINDPKQIIDYLHFGTNLPILPQLKKYILAEISRMGFHSLILEDRNTILGHSCFYFYENTMYFAFFGIPSEDPGLVQYLIQELIEIGREFQMKQIIGPINFPHIIFGWGFAEEGSSQELFAAADYTNPRYISYFERAGFSIMHRILRFKVPTQPIPLPNPDWNITYGDVSRKGRTDWKDHFIDMQMRLFPRTTQVTPNIIPFFDGCMDFIQEFSSGRMIIWGFDPGKKDRVPIGLGFATPNCYDMNQETGRCQSMLMFGGVIEPEYQRRGVLKHMLIMISNWNVEDGVTHGEMPIGEDNPGSIHMAKSYGGTQNRSHVIMNLKL